MQVVCANRTCKKRDVPLKGCSECKAVKYCSKDCQLADWSSHKSECSKDLRKQRGKECENLLEQTLAARRSGSTSAILHLAEDTRQLHPDSCKSKRVRELRRQNVQMATHEWQNKSVEDREQIQRMSRFVLRLSVDQRARFTNELMEAERSSPARAAELLHIVWNNLQYD